jgi:hypothetical protein
MSDSVIENNVGTGAIVLVKSALDLYSCSIRKAHPTVASATVTTALVVVARLCDQWNPPL